ncbi:hypothetical protein ASPWEDRAFT_107543 [Aspergillus wentii DTO 134E9]|uniref:Transcription initiation factor TFIID subunit 8 n=1 Tax=Aspergillus wentii DTO 134E9 TaxID=1073089 RepID=A0A1L9RND6_ASPWE|nr:uncharacterized protein ASPWEDRAFT_107543 [Aspergillus wentii DTO 134E9]KAI9926103.1 hypothetical protein MW887_004565 [Aspergillus wentii]OJJ36450.1 hypothetical protein ASPWEDRAFT_107543 [Aspergillus wentii DTO 134E9]
MLPSEPVIKRSTSSFSERLDGSDTKRVKRVYHHHHRLQSSVVTSLQEPAIADESCIDHLMNRSIGQTLQESGFDLADPVALDSFRNAAEEYLLKFASFVRQSMLTSRRIQPIPQDFEHAMKRQSLRADDLLPYLKPLPNVEPNPTLLPTPPPEEDFFKSVSFLGPQLSGEEDRSRSAHIPRHFPEFPSKHTYRHTPVFTEREQDPRKIREKATEDGRHGEEALRKLARASFKDNQLGSAGRDKKPWGRRTETMDSMFEKTVKGLAKRMQKTASVPGAAPMEIDSGTMADPSARHKAPLNLELPPIINCERELWRRTTASGNRRPEEKPNPAKGGAPNISRVDSWVST